VCTVCFDVVSIYEYYRDMRGEVTSGIKRLDGFYILGRSVFRVSSFCLSHLYLPMLYDGRRWL
jgi:hypothetical protein